MSQNKITQLTSEQEALLAVYREKWHKIAFCTEPINRDRATEAVESIYAVMKWGEPEILFFHSLNDAVFNLPKLLESRLEKSWSILGKPLNKQIVQLAGNILTTQFLAGSGFFNVFSADFSYTIERKVYMKIWQEIQTKCWYFGLNNIWLIYNKEIKKQIRPILKPVLGKKQEARLERKIFRNLIHSAQRTFDNILNDYFIDVFQFPNNSQLWHFEKQLYENSGCFLFCEKLAIVCDRPKTILTLDERYLHAEGKAALEFRDNFKIYAHRGIAIPEKYGKVNSSQWKPEWLLTETDKNVKDTLCKRLGIKTD